MRVTTPEINWHNKDPVYSVDFCQGVDGIARLASCGTDCFVRLWSIEWSKKIEGETKKKGEKLPTPTKAASGGKVDGEEADEQEVKIDHRATLVRHSKAVNVVRFSKDGRILASAGDDAVICLWRREKERPSMVREEEEFNEEWWKVFKTLRGHLDDVYDLSWSQNGLNIVSGSIDNSAIVWNAKTGDKLAILREHKGLVQGVGWDPRNAHVATLSTDRCLRLFSVEKKYRCNATIFKMARVDPAKANAAALEKTNDQNKENAASSAAAAATSKKPATSNIRLYHDDTMKSFFRRPAFSPDGQLLITPAGLWNEAEDSKPTNAAFIYNLRTKEPAVRLPLHDKAAIAARFCPTLFSLRPASAKKSGAAAEEQRQPRPAQRMINLPYRMVFAIATEDAVVIYDTQQTLPLGIVGGIHYHQLSDLTWSPDGRLLLVSSTDGFCSVVAFDQGELGKPYEDAAAAMKEVTAMMSVWKPKEEGAGGATSGSARKGSSRASKTKAFEENAKEIAAQMEAKAKVEEEAKMEVKEARKEEKMEESTVEVKSEDKKDSAEIPMTAIKSKPDEGKRRIPLTSLSSSQSSSSSSAFTSSSAPRRVALTTLTANSTSDGTAKAEEKQEAKPEPRRIQLQPASAPDAEKDQKEEPKKPRRVQLTSLVSKPKEEEEPMDC